MGGTAEVFSSQTTNDSSPARSLMDIRRPLSRTQWWIFVLLTWILSLVGSTGSQKQPGFSPTSPSGMGRDSATLSDIKPAASWPFRGSARSDGAANSEYRNQQSVKDWLGTAPRPAFALRESRGPQAWDSKLLSGRRDAHGAGNKTVGDANSSFIATTATFQPPLTTASPAGAIVEMSGPYQEGAAIIPNLGSVNVLKSASFQLPSASDMDDEAFELRISQGDFVGIGAAIPVNAWPSDGGHSIASVTVFEASDTMKSAIPAGSALRGHSVYFEPHNIPFKRPVRIFLPVSTTLAADYENSVFAFEPATNAWLSREDSQPPSLPAGILSGQTESFSAYAALGVLKAENKTDEGSSGCNQECVIGAVVGSVLGACLLGGMGFFAYRHRDEFCPHLSGLEDTDAQVDAELNRRREEREQNMDRDRARRQGSSRLPASDDDL